MRALALALAALIALAACSGPRDPQAERISQIRLHCMSAGAPTQGPQYGYSTSRGLGYTTPGGFMQGYQQSEARNHAERECLRSYGLWP